MEFERLPEEFARPPMEPATAMEPKGMPEEIFSTPEQRGDKPGDEFEGKSGGSAGDGEDGSRHGLVKKLMMMPVATTIATLTIVFASYGVDPLGDDFLNHEGYHDYVEEHEKDHERSGDHGHSSGRENVREYPGDITDAYVHVTYVPTGEEYFAGGTGEYALNDAREWVAEQGGDPDSLTYVDHYFSTRLYADGPIVGDPDNLASAYDPWGNIHEEEVVHIMYYAYESVDDVPADVSYDPENGRDGLGDYGEQDQYVFPELNNLEPDFDGNYAATALYYPPFMGSEEYVRMGFSGDQEYTYLHAGQFWKDQYGAQEVRRSDVSYDAEKNVLTLHDCEAEVLDVNLMGNGFTIELIGNNYVNQVVIWGYQYGGSVRFTGSGSLVINDHYATPTGGLLLRAENSESCIMVEDDVILEIYGYHDDQLIPAVRVLESTMDPVLYHSPAVEVYAKSTMTGSSGEGIMIRDGDGFVITAPDGTVADYVHFAPKE